MPILVLPPRTPPKPANDAGSKIAARDAAQNDAFLREVDDALREDEFFGLLRRYGKPVLAVVVAALAGLAFYLWWGNYRHDQQAAHAEQFTLALDQLDAGNLGTAVTDLAPLNTGKDGNAAAARMLSADITLKQGHADAAANAYGALAADSNAPGPFRDLASIREVAVRFDSLAPGAVVARLKPLAQPGYPWFGRAGELVAMAYLKQGNKALAGPLFGAISRDTQTPDSLRARARQMAGLLGYDSIDDIARPPAGDNGAGNAAPAAPAQ